MRVIDTSPIAADSVSNLTTSPRYYFGSEHAANPSGGQTLESRTRFLNGKSTSKAARQMRLAVLAALMAGLMALLKQRERKNAAKPRGTFGTLEEKRIGGIMSATGVPSPPPRGGQLSSLQITT